MNPDLPSPPDRSKAVVVFIAVAIAAAAIGYMGYHRFNKWHDKELQTAVSKEQTEAAKTRAALEAEIQALRAAPPSPEAPPVTPDAATPAADERMAEVFGEGTDAAAPEAEASCDALRPRITAFFDYLRRQIKPAGQGQDAPAQDWVTKTIVDLASSPPLVMEETRDMESLKRNQSHFFRVLQKDRFRMVKAILRVDRDVLEYALADGYRYYAALSCCKADDPACVTLKTLYEYAGFFTSTLSGKSYLLRRDSAIRCLAGYYCVLVLDRAEEASLNAYGIDIRPHIDLALDAVSHQTGLIFRDRYVATLTGLKEKYAEKYPALSGAPDDGDS